jgi:hypothetical protein
LRLKSFITTLLVFLLVAMSGIAHALYAPAYDVPPAFNVAPAHAPPAPDTDESTPTPTPRANPPAQTTDTTSEGYMTGLLKSSYNIPLLGIVQVYQLVLGFAVLIFGVLLSIIAPIFIRQRQAKQAALAQNLNPYTADAPISDPNMFIGHTAIINDIIANVHATNFALYGARHIGKTSLLNYLDHRLKRQVWADYYVFPVSLSLQGVDEETFFQTFMERILLDLSKKKHYTPGKDELHYHNAEKQYDLQDFVHDIHLVKAQLDTRPNRPLRLALLVDDGDVLNQYTQTTLAELRELFTEHTREYLRIVLCRTRRDDRTWYLAGGPWESIFATFHEIGPLSRKEAIRLIKDPVPNYRYTRKATQLIVQRSEGHPRTIQRLCHQAVAAMLQAEKKRGTITHQHVEQALER